MNLAFRRFLQRFGSIALGLPLILWPSKVARAEPAMWVIRDQDSTIFLLGSVHILRPNTDRESPKIRQALKESRELWLELIDADDQAAVLGLMQKYGVEPHGKLTSKLTAEQREKLTKIADGVGFTLTAFDQMKPWTAALMVSTLPLLKSGLDPNLGVDRVLQNEAKKNGLTLHGFETMEEQIKILSDSPEAEQIEFLDESIEEAAKGTELFDKTATAYLQGDLAELEKELIEEVKEKDPVAYQKLLVERNVRWSEKIQKMLAGSGVQMIAVGAGHLVGPDSLIAQLAKRGIKAERY